MWCAASSLITNYPTKPDRLFNEVGSLIIVFHPQIAVINVGHEGPFPPHEHDYLYHVIGDLLMSLWTVLWALCVLIVLPHKYNLAAVDSTRIYNK